MIRVNLMRNRVQDSGQAGVSQSSEPNDSRDAIVKMAFIVLFTIGLMVYESQTIHALNEQVARLQAKAAELDLEAQAKAKEVEGIKDIATQAKELEDKLKVLKLLSRLRLREVKTLDFMQNSIPEKVWLKNVTYNSEMLEKGHFAFTGNAVSTEDLTDFVKRLEDSAYLNDVIIIKNQELAGPVRTGNIRDFFFTAEVESKN